MMLAGYPGWPFRLMSVISEQSLFTSRDLLYHIWGPATSHNRRQLTCCISTPSGSLRWPFSRKTLSFNWDYHEWGRLLIWLLLQSGFGPSILFYRCFVSLRFSKFRLQLFSNTLFEIIMALQKLPKIYGEILGRFSPPLERRYGRNRCLSWPSPPFRSYSHYSKRN